MYLLIISLFIETYDKSLVSEKGKNIQEIYRLGLNVPPAFIISTEQSLEYRYGPPDKDSDLFLLDTLPSAIVDLERRTDQKYGTIEIGVQPMLLSVRVGAPCHSGEVVIDADKGISELSANMNLPFPESLLPESFTCPGNYIYFYVTFLKLLLLII